MTGFSVEMLGKLLCGEPRGAPPTLVPDQQQQDLGVPQTETDPIAAHLKVGAQGPQGAQLRASARRLKGLELCLCGADGSKEEGQRMGRHGLLASREIDHSQELTGMGVVNGDR